jgi:selenocysteine lyase/cysteine desulfurase
MKKIKRIYMNNAASAFPLAPGVIEAMVACMKNPPRNEGRNSVAALNGIGECRLNIAQLMRVSPEDLVFTSGATQALNMAILGFGLKEGDRVVTSVTEHNSVLRPLAHLEDLIGIKVRYIRFDSCMGLDEAEAERLFAEKPRLVILNHASNVTGRIYPVARLFQRARAAGAATLLDAGQSIGRMPVCPVALNADLVAYSGHKGLRGPLGTGVLYVSKHIEIAPVFEGGTGVRSTERRQPMDMPMRLEAGTPNLPAWAGLNAAVLHNLQAADGLRERQRSCTERLISGLKSIDRVRVIDPDCNDRLPIVSFVIEGMDVEEAGFALSGSFGIQCRAGLHCAPLIHQYLGSLPDGTLRFSPSFEVSDEEIDYAVDAVRRLVS